jgi:hypothetical protein
MISSRGPPVFDSRGPPIGLSGPPMISSISPPSNKELQNQIQNGFQLRKTEQNGRTESPSTRDDLLNKIKSGSFQLRKTEPTRKNAFIDSTENNELLKTLDKRRSVVKKEKDEEDEEDEDDSWKGKKNKYKKHRKSKKHTRLHRK